MKRRGRISAAVLFLLSLADPCLASLDRCTRHHDASAALRYARLRPAGGGGTVVLNWRRISHRRGYNGARSSAHHLVRSVASFRKRAIECHFFSPSSSFLFS